MPANPLIKLICGQNQAIINPLGFRLEKLTLNGSLYLDKFTRNDGKMVSSHPCLPIFGPETNTNYNLLQHGETRKSLGEIISQTISALKLNHVVRDGNYPDGLVFEQEFELSSNSLIIESTFTNKSNQTLPVNFAEHFYWNTPSGWHNLKINNEDVAGLVKNDQGINWLEENLIEIPSLPAIILKQTSLPYVQLWSSRDNNQYDEKYICIEPARGRPKSTYFGSTESMLRPNGTIRAKIEILTK